MTIHVIAAVAANGVVGYKGLMPWHIPADLANFRELTTNNIIVMGRKTFDSLGRHPLPNRHNVVISRQPVVDLKEESPKKYKNLEFSDSINEWVLRAKESSKEYWFIGGHDIWATALPHADSVHICRVDAAPKGDTYFPKFTGLSLTDAFAGEHEGLFYTQERYAKVS